jgi:hypothetical protein
VRIHNDEASFVVDMHGRAEWVRAPATRDIGRLSGCTGHARR